MKNSPRTLRTLLPFVLATLLAVPAFAGPHRDPQGTIVGMHPYAYWPLDEKVTGVVYDRTSHHFDGLYEGARAGAEGLAPGKRSAYLAGFPGINIVGEEAAILSDAPRSIVAWIRTYNPEPQTIVSTGHPADGQAFDLVTGYGPCPSVGVVGHNDDFLPCGRILNDGEWHMVGATYDGAGTLRLYVDGTLDAVTTNIRFATWDQNNFIGRSNWWGHEAIFIGYIADVAIFDRALSPTEIAKLAGS